jgi:hypothetical protein
VNASARLLACCHARLPNAGLGNKLLVWGRAFAFARLNRFPLAETGWVRPQLAPFLRGGDLRLYWNFFRSAREISRLSRWTRFRSAPLVREPNVARIEPPTSPTVYEFAAIPHWTDYFRDLKPHRAAIRAALFDRLTHARRCEFERAPKPVICIHVRLADFRPLKAGDDFACAGGTRTPVEYFIRLIEGIRKVRGVRLPVMLVSDGKREQLRELLAMPGVELGPRQTALGDLLMMSASKVVVPSAGSTFGFWAGFLGDNVLLMHPDHIHQAIRPTYVNEKFYEGPAVGPPEQWPEPLLALLRAI